MERANILIDLKRFRALEPSLSISDNISFKTADFSSTVKVFGDFKIAGRNGSDLTSEFSPKIQEMFLLILLHTDPSRYEKTGIKTDKLTEYLWPSLDSAAAKNARGVAVKRLRNILARAEGIELRYEDPYWVIHCSAGCECDYYRVLKLNNELNKTGDSFAKKITRRELYDLLSRGRLLKDCNYDWLYPIKSELTFMFVNQAMQAAENMDEYEDDRLKFNLAEVILKWDSLNENALKLKIRMLNKMGRYGEAKLAYDSFSAEFTRSFQMPYGIKYAELIRSERFSA